MKNSKVAYSLLLCILAYLVVCLASPKANALTMTNDNWSIDIGNVNNETDNITNTKTTSNSNIGKIGPNSYGGKNYSVKLGFKQSRSPELFSFSLNQTVINFGLLTATNPVTRTSTLTISNEGLPGYQVFASENNTLKNELNISIPDTTCDNGSCTETIAAPWKATLTYGFGYRCDTIADAACTPTFNDPDEYKQFADSSKHEPSQTILKGNDGKPTRKAKITYKVNISGTQAPGTYSNTITYIAVPTY